MAKTTSWQGVLTLTYNPCLNWQGLCFCSFRVLGKQQIHVQTKRLGSVNLPVHWITKNVVSKGSFSNLTFCWDSCKGCSPLGKKKPNKKPNKKISDLRDSNVGSIFCMYLEILGNIFFFKCLLFMFGICRNLINCF